MKGTSKVIMGATLVLVFSLVVILGLILVLLAELYCSFLLHRRQIRNSHPQTTTTTTTTATIGDVFSSSHSPTLHPPHHQQQQHSSPPPPPFTSICSQGVLQAPRSILFPPFSSIQHDMAEPKKQHQQLSQLLQDSNANANANANSHCIGLVSVPSSLESFMSRATSKPSQQDSLQGIETIGRTCSGREHLVYISNPIYENGEGIESEPNTPFATPDTSPSRLERSGSSSDDDVDKVGVTHCDVQTLPCTPPLTPMKNLSGPQKASSVSLTDASSLGTSGSDSHTNTLLFSSSSASPSW